MSKITFSKTVDGYSQREVDIYVDMLEAEHTKAVDLITSQTAKIAELENKLSEITIENARMKEDSKRFDLEISKVCEERDALKIKIDEYSKNANTKTSDQIFDDKDSLIEAVLSLARANEKLVRGTPSPKEQKVYHSKSQVDEIVDAVLSEGDMADTSTIPRFSL